MVQRLKMVETLKICNKKWPRNVAAKGHHADPKRTDEMKKEASKTAKTLAWKQLGEIAASRALKCL